MVLVGFHCRKERNFSSLLLDVPSDSRKEIAACNVASNITIHEEGGDTMADNHPIIGTWRGTTTLSGGNRAGTANT